MRLEASGLGHRHQDGAWLFRSLHLKLAAGTILGMMGPSGCGKTTLARVLAGYVRPKEGTVAISGSGASVRSGRLQAPNPVQLIWQQPELAVNPRWRMRRIIEEGAAPGQELLDQLGIASAWLGRLPHELSGGELQRCCVARALACKPSFLIADEMTSMLDAVTQAQLWQTVAGIARQERIGLLVISHQESLLKQLCDRMVYPWEAMKLQKISDPP